jgi:hypothetical protein
MGESSGSSSRSGRSCSQPRNSGSQKSRPKRLPVHHLGTLLRSDRILSDSSTRIGTSIAPIDQLQSLREKFTRERNAAKKLAAEYFQRFPKNRYQTEVESWRHLQSQNIEFTMKRLRELIEAGD